MLALELVVVLAAVVLASEVLARRTRIAPPVLLLAAGALLAVVPQLREVHLPPQVVLLLFLPALLWWESLNTSLRDIRRSLRGIVLVSTLLVVATAAAVAATVHALGLAWEPAWVLGAALAPTDATAVGVLAKVLPRQTTTILRAESLVNDGTALVLYGLAVAVTAGSEHVSAPHVTRLFVVSYAGGAVIGLATAAAATAVRRRLDDPLLENVVILLTPFLAYLLAEEIDASGVLAVVVAGLVMSETGPRVGHAAARQQTVGSWSLATYLLNGALFVLVGLELPSAVRGLTSVDLARGLLAVVAVSVVLVVVRFAFLWVSARIIRLLDRRPSQRLRRVSDRSRVVSALAGFRGAVSLAAALAVPQTIDTGGAFPGRDFIVFVTAGVIAVTLAQSLLLPPVVRWARLPDTSTVEQERRHAETRATEDALAALPDLGQAAGVAPDVVEQLAQEYRQHLQVLRVDGSLEDESALRQHEQDTALRLAALGHKRATVLQLRDQQQIDDTVLRQVQARLDLEELRLSRPQTTD